MRTGYKYGCFLPYAFSFGSHQPSTEQRRRISHHRLEQLITDIFHRIKISYIPKYTILNFLYTFHTCRHTLICILFLNAHLITVIYIRTYSRSIEFVYMPLYSCNHTFIYSMEFPYMYITTYMH